MAERRTNTSDPREDVIDVPALDLIGAGPGDNNEQMAVSPALAGMIRQNMQMTDLDPLPSLDDFLLSHAVLGTEQDLAWMMQVCCPGEEQPLLNLSRIRYQITQLENERSRATAKFLEASRDVKKAAASATVTLASAAAMFYAASYPEVKEHLDIAVEQLGQPLERVLLGLLGHYRDNLHGVDMALVPDTPQGSTLQSPMVSPLGGASPQRACPVCTTLFAPKREKPNQLYCDEPCGHLAYATQTWANNAARTPEMETLPLPDPYQSGIEVALLEHARAWQQGNAVKMLDMAKNKQAKQAGVRRAA